jgi:hypothetical protein
VLNTPDPLPAGSTALADPQIRIVDVVKRFSTQVVLDHVSLAVVPGRSSSSQERPGKST